MKLLAFSVHDAKAEAFVKPFYDVTRGSADMGKIIRCSMSENLIRPWVTLWLWSLYH